MKKQNSISRRRDGVAAVEAAVCLPILFVIIFGAIEVSGGIFQEYNAQACAFELSKVALESGTSCEDVQTKANALLPQLEFTNYSIEIEVVPRSVNADSVEPAVISSFSFSQSGSAPAGLEDIPRGTLLRLTLTLDRPAIAGRGFARAFLSNQIETDCVFVKEF